MVFVINFLIDPDNFVTPNIHSSKSLKAAKISTKDGLKLPESRLILLSNLFYFNKP